MKAIKVTLLNTDGSDGSIVNAFTSEVEELNVGSFTRAVIILPNQDVAFAGQPLSANYNHEKRRWQVPHPCN